MQVNSSLLCRMVEVLTHHSKTPLYKEKLKDVDIDLIRGWVQELCQDGKITKLDGTGAEELDGKWFSTFMAEIHGTLGCLSVNGGSEVDDLRELHTRGLSYKIATEFDGRNPTKWEQKELGDPHEALRVKVIEMLGSEGPQIGDILAQRLHSRKRWSSVSSLNWKHEMCFQLVFTNRPMTMNIY